MKKKITKKELKVGDIFHSSWKERVWGDQKDHCFEGLFIIMQDEEGEKWFVDTFWGVNRWDNKKWKFTETNELFKLNFYVNLNDLEKVEHYSLDDYSDEDLFTLHDQHACVKSCIYHFKRKGAIKNPQKKISKLQEEINEEKRKVEWAVRNIESKSAEIKKLELQGFNS